MPLRSADWGTFSCLCLNVSGLEQTARFLPNKVELFPLNAPSSLAGEPGTGKSSIQTQNRKHDQTVRFISVHRKARLLGGFHEESIVADWCNCPAGRAGVCTNSRDEPHSRPDQHSHCGRSCTCGDGCSTGCT